MHSVGQLTRCSKILTLKIKSITYSWTGNSTTLLHLLLHVAPISCHLAFVHWYCVAEHTECQTVSNVHARFAGLSCSVLYCFSMDDQQSPAGHSKVRFIPSWISSIVCLLCSLRSVHLQKSDCTDDFINIPAAEQPATLTCYLIQ